MLPGGLEHVFSIFSSPFSPLLLWRGWRGLEGLLLFFEHVRCTNKRHSQVPLVVAGARQLGGLHRSSPSVHPSVRPSVLQVELRTTVNERDDFL